MVVLVGTECVDGGWPKSSTVSLKVRVQLWIQCVVRKITVWMNLHIFFTIPCLYLILTKYGVYLNQTIKGLLML